MIGIVLGSAASIAALAAAVPLAYRRLRQRRVARTLVIDTPAGIVEGRYIGIGGIDQWIQIRGVDRRRPDLLHAYVGTGQIADMARNEHLTHRLALDRARTAGNRKAVKALERHPPPYRDARTWITKLRWSMATDPEMQTWQRRAPATLLSWPGYTLADIYRSAFGALFLPPQLFTETMACTPETLGTRFDVPFLILHGDADLQTLPSLAEKYLTAVDAPTKEFLRLPDTGHLSMLAQPDLFLTELLTRVHPLATTPPTTA